MKHVEVVYDNIPVASFRYLAFTIASNLFNDFQHQVLIDVMQYQLLLRSYFVHFDIHHVSMWTYVCDFFLLTMLEQYA